MGNEEIQKTKKEKMSVSNKVLIASILAVVIYTVVAITLQFCMGVEASPTLTEYWYRFWTVEIVVLSGIRISKVFKAHNGIVVDEHNGEGVDE